MSSTVFANIVNVYFLIKIRPVSQATMLVRSLGVVWLLEVGELDKTSYDADYAQMFVIFREIRCCIMHSSERKE